MSVDLDKQIDRAVRDMLDVEPSADLRARVMAQLPAPGSPRPAPGFRLPASWVLGSIAAAALVVIAVFVARRTEPVPQPPAIAKAADRYLAPEAAPLTVDVPVVRTRRAPAAAPRAESTGSVLAAVFTADEPGTMRIAPLGAIAPISVAPIAHNAIAPAEVAVRPLNTMTEIQIAPLTPPDRR
jgi:hypothetical protein